MPRHPLDPAGERGIALVIALMGMLLLSALGAALVLTTSTETLLTANYRDSAEAMYAADAGIERVLPDLLGTEDWGPVLAGTARSTFVDGAPSGTRVLPTGATFDLGKATNLLNCAKVETCSDADMDAYSAERPWAENNPRWQPYAYGPLASLLEDGAIASNMYIVVWVADDPGENDGDPLADGVGAGNPGSGVISLRAEAYGVGGIHKVIEATVSRTTRADAAGGYRGQRGQGEHNQRSGRAGIDIETTSTIALPGGTP